MHPVVRTIGKMLRLVGISSPEDAEARKKSAAELPSWKVAKVPTQTAIEVPTEPIE